MQLNFWGENAVPYFFSWSPEVAHLSVSYPSLFQLLLRQRWAPLSLFSLSVSKPWMHILLSWSPCGQKYLRCEQHVKKPFIAYTTKLWKPGVSTAVSLSPKAKIFSQEKNRVWSYIYYMLLIQRKTKMAQAKHAGHYWLFNTEQRDFEHTN